MFKHQKARPLASNTCSLHPCSKTTASSLRLYHTVILYGTHLDHVLCNIEYTVACRLGSDVRAAPQSALTGEHALLLGAQALVLAEQVATYKYHNEHKRDKTEKQCVFLSCRSTGQNLQCKTKKLSKTRSDKNFVKRKTYRCLFDKNVLLSCTVAQVSKAHSGIQKIGQTIKGT